MKGKLKNKKIFWIFLCSYILIILIPVILLAGYFWPKLQRTALKEAEITDLNNMNRIVQTMDVELEGVYTLPSRIFNHPHIILSEVMDDAITQRNVKMELADILGTNSFPAFCMLYMREADYFLSARASSFCFDDFYKYPGVYQMILGGMPLEELHNLLETIDENQVLYADAVGMSSNYYQNALMFLMPVPRYSNALATLLVCVPMSQLDMITQPVHLQDGMIVFIEPDGNVVYSTSPEAKDILAALQQPLPFEPQPVTQLLQSGDEEYMVTAAKSGKNGWKYVSMTPMKSIMEASYQIQQGMLLVLLVVIVLSSICVALAMKLNYTPIHRLSILADRHGFSAQEQQNEFAQIRNLIVSLHMDKQHMENTLNTSKLHMRDMMLTRILCGNEQEVQDVIRRGSVLHMDTCEPQWQVILAQYASEQDADGALEKIDDSQELLALRIDKPSQVVYVRTGAESEQVPDEILRRIGNPLKLTVSSLVPQLDKLGGAYAAACATMDYFLSSDKDGLILYCSEMPERFYNPRFYPLDVMQALDTAITHGSYKRMGELVGQLESLLAVEGAPPYYTRSVYYSAISLMINGLRHYSTDNEGILTELTIRSALPRYTVREMREILRGTAEKLAEIMRHHEEKASPWTARLEYIDRQLSSPDLSLQDVADQAGMSASSFSRAFKENVGKSFKEYVDDLRLLRARQLLSDSNLPIEQIALQVGYENITSFYRFFKKYVGIAPGEYRNASINERNANL